MYRVMGYPQLSLLRRTPLGGIIQSAICRAVVGVYTNTGCKRLYVRFWPKADILTPLSQCPLSGVKQTLIGCAAMSAFDPKRTFGPEGYCPGARRIRLAVTHNLIFH